MLSVSIQNLVNKQQPYVLLMYAVLVVNKIAVITLI